MGHKRARTILAAADLYDNLNFLDVDPVASVVKTNPDHVHKFSAGVLRADSPLLNSTRGSDLARILGDNNRFVLLDPGQLAAYTDTNICQAPGSIPALLRQAWYDTYSYVEPNSTLPDYSDSSYE
jgi:hypothetical protein